MIYKGTLNKRGGGQGESGDLMVFLFDHALLMVKPKTKVEQYKVYRRVRTCPFTWPSPFIFFHSCLAHPVRIASHLRPRRLCGETFQQATTASEESTRSTTAKRPQGWFLHYDGSSWTEVLSDNTMGEHVR